MLYVVSVIICREKLRKMAEDSNSRDRQKGSERAREEEKKKNTAREE